MLIALDYDETFTRDPDGWSDAMSVMRSYGHTVIGCTMRTPQERHGMHERYFDVCHEVYFSSRQGKREYLASNNLFPNVWIDDTPDFICMDSADRLLINPVTN